MPSEFLKLKAQMPILGVGLGLRGHFSKDIIEHASSIDFLEFTPENYADNIVSTNWLANYAEHFPLVAHSVSLSIGSVDPLSKDLLAMERRFAELFNLHWWSDHLCFTGVDGQTSHDLLPLPWTEEAVKHVCAKIRMAQEAVGKPLAIENIPFYSKMPRGDYREDEFISMILEEADCGLLLDLNNLLVNSINHNFDARAFLDNLPLERVVQIHLAGHRRFGQRIIDTHGAAIEPVLLDLLEQVLKNAPAVNAIMIERDQQFPGFKEILAELDAVRAIWNKAVPGAAPGGNPRSPLLESPLPLSIIPRQLVSELAPVDDPSPEPPGKLSFRIDREPEKSFSDLESPLRPPDLGRYQREWYAIWNQIKGCSPLEVDTQNFKAEFVQAPKELNGYDLRALSIYGWMRDCGREHLLRSIFPSTCMLLSRRWKRVVEQYFYDWRPAFFDLEDIGAEFPKFMEESYSELFASQPFLNELINYELLRWNVGRKHELTAVASEVYLGTSEQIQHCRPFVNPELTIEFFKFPVEEMRRAQSLEDLLALAAQEPGEAAPYAILPHAFQSKSLRLSSVAADIIEAARAGKLSYSQLIASVMTEAQRESPEEIAEFIRLLRHLHEEKIFLRCILPDGSAQS